MTTEREMERIVRSWLEPGLTTLTDDVLDPVLDQLPATPQRRPVQPLRRIRIVSPIGKLSVAGAAAVIVAIVAINLASPSGPPIVGTTATSTPSAPPSGTAVSPTPDEPALPSPVASASTPPIGTASSAPVESPSLPSLRLPGAFASRAGDYGFESHVRPTAGMHKYLRDGSREVADLTFSVLCDPTEWDEPTQQVNVAGFDGVYAEPYEPAVTFTGPEGDETTRAYALPVGERTLCVYLTWHATTTAEERAALLQIVETIRAEHIQNGRRDSVRVIFTLDEGWDVG